MIVDFGMSQGSPRLWLITDVEQELLSFRQLIAELSDGRQNNISLLTYGNLFALIPPISDVELSVAPPGEGNRILTVKDQSKLTLNWKLTREEWLDVLPKIDAFQTGHGHQYFDYDTEDITIMVSYKEGLKRRWT
jgi:hypothetical protein